MDIEDYQEKDISGKILYLASLFKGIKDHLKILNEMDELTGVESQMFTILNDLQLGINELCILYEKIDKQITYLQSKMIIKWLIDINLINSREAKIILCTIDDKSLNTPICGLNDIIRAKILKNMIEELFNIEE